MNTPRTTAQRARAAVVLYRLAAGVFAGAGVFAVMVFHSVLIAALFVSVAVLLASISIFAALKARRDHPWPIPSSSRDPDVPSR